MIGSRVSLNFMDFVYHLTPIVIIIMVCYIVAIKLIWGKQLQTKESLKKRIMNMNEREAIKDPVMLRNSLFVLTVVFMGFIFHGMLGLEVATVGLFGAGLLLLLSRSKEPRHIFAEIEWSTIFFFIGLFIIVGGVVKVGLIKWMSIKMVEITGGNLFITSMVMIWFSAFASAIVDNIPYVATMIPLVSDMAKHLWPDLSGVQLLQHPDLMPVWWSLALGACLGGNGTVIGAAANIVVVGMSEKIGQRISFMAFMKYGMPIMIMTVIVSTLYMWLRYYVFKI